MKKTKAICKLMALCCFAAALLVSGCAVLWETVPNTNAPTPSSLELTASPSPTPDEIVEGASVHDGLSGVFTVKCESFLNLRSEPDEDSDILTHVLRGTRVRVLGFDEKFANIELEDTGEKGYVLAGYLQPADGDSVLESLSVGVNTAVYNYETMMADLLMLTVEYSGKCRLDYIGSSVEGLDIPLVLVGNESAPYHIFVQAAIHAREHMTSQLAVAQIAYMLKYSTDPDIAAVLNSTCFHIVPVSNPDGVYISQRGGGVAKQLAIYEREVSDGKTSLSEYQYFSEWKANASGVDLNRNFDAGWDLVQNSGEKPNSQNYKGERPESEPETQALVEYIKSRHFDATVSYHSMGSIIYWEYGGASDKVNEESRVLAQVVSELTGYPLKPSGVSSGGFKDWAMEVMEIPSVTIETGTRKCPLPADEFYMIWFRNYNVLLEIAKSIINE